MPIFVGAGDHLQLTLKGTFNDKSVVENVFHYDVQVALIETTLETWGAGLASLIVDPLIAGTTSAVSYSEINCALIDDDANLINNVSYFLPAGFELGVIGGDGLPVQDCYTFKYVRNSGTSRHGYKRFAGVPEDYQDNGTINATGAIFVTAMEAVLEAPLVPYSIDTGGAPDTPLTPASAFPVVVQKQLNGDILSPALFNRPVAVVFNGFGTQNTRKVGRGV